MSTPASPVVGVSEGLDSARSALASALSGAAPAPTPSSAPAPAPAESAPPAAPALTTPPQVAAPVTEATPSAPQSPSPLPLPSDPLFSNLPAGLRPPSSPPATPDAGNPPVPGAPLAPPSITDPAAARFLEMKGGDVQRALADGLAYNNRLAALKQSNPELFAPGAPLDPHRPLSDLPTDTVTPVPGTSSVPATPELGAPTTPPTPDPGPEIPVNWEQITAETEKAVLGDNVCRALINEWTQNDKTARESATEIGEKTARLSYLSSLLKDSESLSLPELRVEEFRDEARSLKTDIATLKQESLLLSLTNDRLDQRFRARRSDILDTISSTYQGQAREQAEQAQLQQLETTEFQRLTSVWPGAVQRVVAASQIPVELSADFQGYAKQVALATFNTPNFQITDVEAFLTSVAKDYTQRLDNYHRMKAAQYGHLAAQRAASPSPVATTPTGTPTPPPAPNRMLTPEEAISAAQSHLQARIRGTAV